MNIYNDPISDALGIRNLFEIFPDLNPKELYALPEDAVLNGRGGSTSKTNGFKGHKLSPEHLQAFCYDNKGRVRSEETRAKISHSLRTNGYTDSEETRAKKSAAAKLTKNALGSKHTEETKALYSAQRRGVPKLKVECPHCQKAVAVNTAKRWHFDNCKAL